MYVVKYLIDKGADFKIYNRNNDSSLDLVNNYIKKELLHIAIEEGNKELTEALLESEEQKSSPEQLSEFVNAQLNRYYRYYTPLQLVNKKYHDNREEKNIKIAELLVKKGAFIYSKGCYFSTDLSSILQYTQELFVYVKVGNLEDVKACIEKGVFINAKDKDKKTPLSLAAENGYIDICDLLCCKGADIDSTSQSIMEAIKHLFAYVKGGNLEGVKACIEKGAIINAKDKDNKTPLYLAAKNKRLDVIKYLVEKGADINIKDEDGSTFLVISDIMQSTKNLFAYVEKGDLRGVNLCIKEAIINYKDKDGKTPLHFATQSGFKDIAEALLDKGADVSAKDSNYVTPLHLTAELISDKSDLVEYLIKRNADVNAKDKYSCTPLHLAAKNCCCKIVEFLIKYVKDENSNKLNEFINVKDENDNTPLKLLEKEFVLHKLLEKGQLKEDMPALQAYNQIKGLLEPYSQQWTVSQAVVSDPLSPDAGLRPELDYVTVEGLKERGKEL